MLSPSRLCSQCCLSGHLQHKFRARQATTSRFGLSVTVPRRMLTESSFFYHASAEFVDKICEDVEDVFFAPGERIVKVGEACRLGLTPCYVLLCGEAVVEDEFSLKVGTLWPGDVFGE
ncbi:unnamed protein product, partial [Prorocentrum cordatum]